jgi:hypothetical protein
MSGLGGGEDTNEGNMVSNDNDEVAEQLVIGGIHTHKSNLWKREKKATSQFFAFFPIFHLL